MFFAPADSGAAESSADAAPPNVVPMSVPFAPMHYVDPSPPPVPQPTFAPMLFQPAPTMAAPPPVPLPAMPPQVMRPAVAPPMDPSGVHTARVRQPSVKVYGADFIATEGAFAEISPRAEAARAAAAARQAAKEEQAEARRRQKEEARKEAEREAAAWAVADDVVMTPELPGGSGVG